MRRYIFIVIYILFTLDIHQSFAQNADLTPVKVRTIINSPAFTSPVPLQILKDTNIQRLNSFSVADALRYFSGVQIKDYGGIGGIKTVNTRSLGSNHTALFYDGVAIGNMQNGQIDLGKFSLDNIEEIRLYNAGNTSMLQPAIAYASGATIYLQSKTPNSENYKPYLKTTVKSGSFGLFNPSILWQQKLNNNYSLTLSAEHIRADGQYKFRYKTTGYDTTATRKNADITADRIELGFIGKYRDSSIWNTHLYFYNSQRGLPGAIVNNNFYNSQRLWDKDIFIQTKYDKKINSFYQLSVISKFSYDFTRYIDPETVGTNGILNNVYNNQEYYISFANQFKINSFWTVLASFDGKYNYLNANLYDFAYPSRKTILGLVASQWKWRQLEIQANVLQTMTFDRVSFGPRQPNRKIATPTLSFSWQPFDWKNIRIRGFYKDIFRMPTFNDLYYTSIGYVNLKPEYAKQYDLGLNYVKNISKIWDYISFNLDGYYNHVNDKIIAVPSTNLFRWKMTNLDKVAIYGLNANIKSKWTIDNHWSSSLGIQYTWEKALNKTPGTNYNNLIPYSPINSGSATFNLNYKSWSLNYSYLYTGYRYNIADITLPNSYVSPWYTHDISLIKNITYLKHNLTFLAEVNNLLNQHYDVILNYPMPGRNYKFSLSITL
ncbi:TonB-dependent receptor plug domain-containing protein [Rhizosphaericola mali]|uniref:TonB-dependent receptor n=1 Tax=Rhizosphaericola mali TaxID=2545455 RepID=A0A5P2FVH1_9BACT|nr:TonB-dependent receptor [Rhizosphaericola mali]QES87494.1 TonB-dependent receptor [Rhizosphaericola mali]